MPAPPSSASRARRFSLVRCLTTCFSTTVIITGAIILIVWLSIRPKEIDYAVVNAAVKNYNFSGDDHLTADFALTIKAKNTNAKVSMYYDSIEATLSYDLHPIASARFPPFYQPKGNTTEFVLVFPAKRAVLPDNATADFRNESLTTGKVAVDVAIYAKIRFKVWFVKTSHWMKVFCSPVQVPLNNKGFQVEYCGVFM